MKKDGFKAGLLAAALVFTVSGCQQQNVTVTETGDTELLETEMKNGIENGIEMNTETNTGIHQETSSLVLEKPLTGPPEISLTDSLSSTLDSFTVTSGNYSWNWEEDTPLAEDEIAGVVACGIHPLEMDEELAEKLHVPDYNQMEGAMYTVSCAVMPDEIVITGWDRADLGSPESPAKETAVYGDVSLIPLKKGMVYELKAVWEDEKLADRGFYGEASYVFLTDGNSDHRAVGEDDDRAENLQQEAVVVKKEKRTETLAAMALYSSCPFVYGEKEWELQTFVQEDMLVNGELAMDDRGDFLIRAVSGEDSYVLFEETVQLGMPEADVWIDEQEKLHVVLRDVRTARYRVTDFVYDLEREEFLGSHVIDRDGINYLGTTEK